jgi:hypothetical protein
MLSPATAAAMPTRSTGVARAMMRYSTSSHNCRSRSSSRDGGGYRQGVESMHTASWLCCCSLLLMPQPTARPWREPIHELTAGVPLSNRWVTPDAQPAAQALGT